jgi:hypothetical protein
MVCDFANPRPARPHWLLSVELDHRHKRCAPPSLKVRQTVPKLSVFRPVMIGETSSSACALTSGLKVGANIAIFDA